MNTPSLPVSTNYARMLIVAAHRFRQKQDAPRWPSPSASDPKAIGPQGATRLLS
jgi:hypothetical protein